MADSPAFEAACAALEDATSLNRLEARGTVRLALKQGGLEARSVSADQMAVVAEKILPTELRSRGIAEADGVCQRIRSALQGVASHPAEESPESVFQRLGGA